MKYSTRILSYIEDYLKTNHISQKEFSEETNMNIGTVSKILNGIRPLSVRQLDQVTSFMGLPAGELYDLYAEEVNTYGIHWRRLRPFFSRCAELEKLDCVKILISRMAEFTSAAGFFETAEALFMEGKYKVACMLYETVIESERKSYSDRLAMSHFRVFQISRILHPKNYDSIIRFLPYRNRLEEPQMLDALLMIAEAYFLNERWEEVTKYGIELHQCALSLLQYKSDQSFRKPALAYYGHGLLLESIGYTYMKRFDEAEACISLYANLEQIDNAPENIKIINRYKELGHANRLSIGIKKGDERYIPDYLEFLNAHPEEILEGLANLLEAANRYEINIDYILDLYSSHINLFHEASGQVDVGYQKELDMYRYTFFSYNLAIYYFNKKMVEKGLKNSLHCLHSSTIIKLDSYTVQIMTLFEFYRNDATLEQIETYKSYCERVSMHEKISNTSNVSGIFI